MNKYWRPEAEKLRNGEGKIIQIISLFHPQILFASMSRATSYLHLRPLIFRFTDQYTLFTLCAIASVVHIEDMSIWGKSLKMRKREFFHAWRLNACRSQVDLAHCPVQLLFQFILRFKSQKRVKKLRKKFTGRSRSLDQKIMKKSIPSFATNNPNNKSSFDLNSPIPKLLQVTQLLF